jgi:hypothetical protein
MSFEFDFCGYSKTELESAFQFWGSNNKEMDGYDRPDNIVLEHYNQTLSRRDRYKDDSDIFDIARGFDAHRQRARIGGLLSRQDCQNIKDLAYKDGWNSETISSYLDPSLDFVYKWFYGVGFHANPHHEHPIVFTIA